LQLFWTFSSNFSALAADAWKEPETEVYLLTADVFGAKFKDM